MELLLRSHGNVDVDLAYYMPQNATAPPNDQFTIVVDPEGGVQDVGWGDQRRASPGLRSFDRVVHMTVSGSNFSFVVRTVTNARHDLREGTSLRNAPSAAAAAAVSPRPVCLLPGDAVAGVHRRRAHAEPPQHMHRDRFRHRLRDGRGVVYDSVGRVYLGTARRTRNGRPRPCRCATSTRPCPSRPP